MHSLWLTIFSFPFLLQESVTITLDERHFYPVTIFSKIAAVECMVVMIGMTSVSHISVCGPTCLKCNNHFEDMMSVIDRQITCRHTCFSLV